MSRTVRGLDRLSSNRVEERLPFRHVLAYSAPNLPLSSIGLPLGIYLPAYYATDPVIGMLGDRFPSRYGRRRHWLLASVPVMMIVGVLVFMPHYVVGETATPSYVLGTLLLLYLGYTLAVLSHMSWGAELPTNYHECSRIQGWREWIHHVIFSVALVTKNFLADWFK
jgi:Na+/melibiose symporter-like transporter